MPKNFVRDGFTWPAYLFLALYSFFINIIGPLTPFLKDELGLSYTVSSLHYTAFALGMLVIGLGGNQFVARLGRGRALWIAAFGLSAGAALLIFGKSPFLTIGAAFLMGLIGSLTIVVVPSALSDQHGELRPVALSEANVIAALGATTAPLLVGFCARLPLGWRLAPGLVAFVPLLMYFFFRNTHPLETSPAAQARGAKRPLPRLYWVYWLALVLGVAAEFCMISWSADYLETTLGMPTANAAQAVSIFLFAMIIGRLAGSRLVQWITPYQLVPASALVAMGGFLLFWLAGSVPLGLFGLLLSGLGIANFYPLILSLSIGAAGGDTVQASTRAALASGFGILVLPLTLGRLADAVGIHSAYSVMIALLLGVLLIVLVAGSRHKAQVIVPNPSHGN